jgi:hypothetical protein
VFVSRKISLNLSYDAPDLEHAVNDSQYGRPVGLSDRPRVVRFAVAAAGADNELEIAADVPISDGSTIVDNNTGRIYRVLERYESRRDKPPTILLDRPWEGTAESVWLVSRPVGGGRDPCIAVYQKVMRF